MRVSAATDVGRWREQNEDGHCVQALPQFPGGWLLAVADGIGGSQAGEVASAVAIAELRAVMAQVASAEAVAPTLSQAIRRANRRILEEAAGKAQLAGMGTTLTAAVCWRDRLWIGHVGDSRAYLFHDGALVQLTEDHSLVGELIKNGDLSEAEAMVHPQRHVIIRALGIQQDVEFDLLEYALGPNDILVLATDGLTDLVTSQELEALLAQGQGFPSLAERLVELANQRGGHDNITVVLGAWDGEEGAA